MEELDFKGLAACTPVDSTPYQVPKDRTTKRKSFYASSQLKRALIVSQQKREALYQPQDLTIYEHYPGPSKITPVIVIVASQEAVKQNGLCKCFFNHLGSMYNTRPNPISPSPSSTSNPSFPTSKRKPISAPTSRPLHTFQTDPAAISKVDSTLTLALVIELIRGGKSPEESQTSRK